MTPVGAVVFDPLVRSVANIEGPGDTLLARRRVRGEGTVRTMGRGAGGDGRVCFGWRVGGDLVGDSV